MSEPLDILLPVIIYAYIALYLTVKGIRALVRKITER